MTEKNKSANMRFANSADHPLWTVYTWCGKKEDGYDYIQVTRGQSSQLTEPRWADPHKEWNYCVRANLHIKKKNVVG